jgi:DNA polymerase-1
MYGGTTGDGGRLLPRLARAYPRAIAMVDAAAREGERGERVRTWLGRTSPPGRRDAPEQQARAWGRFTRNFIVQGTAAEWALCWLGGIRGRLAAEFEGPFPEAVPHLVFFLHDEVIVHAPQEDAPRVAQIIEEAAKDAGRLLFGSRPAMFPLSCSIVPDYAAAK